MSLAKVLCEGGPPGRDGGIYSKIKNNKLIKNMSTEQPNTFENKTIIKDRTLEVQNEKRPNIEALERKADENVLEAILVLSLKVAPKDFNLNNIRELTARVGVVLFEHHKIPLLPEAHPEGTATVKKEKEESEIRKELNDTYTNERIERVLRAYINDINPEK